MSNVLRGDGGFVVVRVIVRREEGEALAPLVVVDGFVGARAAVEPEVGGAMGEEEELFFDLVPDAMVVVAVIVTSGSGARHCASVVYCTVGIRGASGR